MPRQRPIVKRAANAPFVRGRSNFTNCQSNRVVFDRWKEKTRTAHAGCAGMRGASLEKRVWGAESGLLRG